MLEKFETVQCFLSENASNVYATPEKFENTTVPGHFGLVFEGNMGREISRFIIICKNLPFQMFKFFLFEELFQKVPFS